MKEVVATNSFIKWKARRLILLSIRILDEAAVHIHSGLTGTAQVGTVHKGILPSRLVQDVWSEIASTFPSTVRNLQESRSLLQIQIDVVQGNIKEKLEKWIKMCTTFAEIGANRSIGKDNLNLSIKARHQFLDINHILCRSFEESNSYRWFTLSLKDELERF